MKKLYIIFLLLSIIQYSYAQLDNTGATITETAETFTFGQHMDENTSYDYTASEYIKLVEGQGLNFEYSPNGDNYFKASNDPLLVFPPEEGVTGGPPNNNEGGVVGTIPGSFSVSPTGAAVYSIPIDLPPGISGMTPQLSLVYYSQGGEGIMGKGWSVGGWSFIGRVSEAPYYNDGYHGNVDFSGDGFELDGKRLIIKEDHGEGLIEYRTEVDEISKILRHNASGKSKDGQYFEVWTNAGIKKEYGSTIDSKQIFDLDANPAIRYHLNKVSDINGNYIEYEYLSQNAYRDEGECYLYKIRYTLNDNLSNEKYYTVVFDYGNPNTNDFYYSSFFNNGEFEYRFRVAKQLQGISIYYDNESDLIKKYVINYAHGNPNSLFSAKDYVNSIGLETSTGEKLNKTVFSWGYNKPIEEPDAHMKRWPNEIDPQDPWIDPDFPDPDFYKYIVGDFNGDNISDIVEYLDADWPDGPPRGIQVRFCKDIYNHVAFVTEDVGEMRKIDIDADGKDELLLVKSNSTDLYSFESQGYSSNFIGSISGTVEQIGDFNGDGYMDCIFNNGTDFSFYPGTNDLNSFIQTSNSNLISGYPNMLNDITADFNGDGKDQLLDLNTQYTKVYSFKGPPSYLFEMDFVDEDIEVEPDELLRDLSVGDFNGDGKVDMLMTKTLLDQSTRAYIYYSYGKGFTAGIEVNHDDYYNKSHIIADLNNDGISDIYSVLMEKDGWDINLTFQKHFKKLSKDAGFKLFTSEIELSPEGFNGSGNYEYYKSAVLFGDFSPDGQKDLIFSLYNVKQASGQEPIKLIREIHSYTQYWGATGGANQDVVRGITNGFGVTHKINYYQYRNNINFPQSYPVLNLKQFLPVVSKTFIEDDEITSIVDYTYSNAKFHALGKGFLGFKETTVKNLSAGTYTYTEYDYYDNDGSGLFYYPYPKLIEQSSLDENGDIDQLISKTQNLMDHKLTTDKDLIYLPFITKSLTNAWDNDDGHAYIKTVKTEQDEADLDEYGNSLEYFIKTDPDLITDFTTTGYDYYTKIENTYDPLDLTEPIGNIFWWVNRIGSTTTEKKYSTLDADIKKTVYDYYQDAENHYPLLKSITNYPNTTNPNNFYITQNLYNDYDVVGNLLQKTIKAENDPQTPDRVITYDYDNDGSLSYDYRFLTSITKTIGGQQYIEAFRYDVVTGKKTQSFVVEDDIEKNKTKYYYDKFGKLEKTIHPDNVNSKVVFRWGDGHADAPNGAVFYSWTKRSGNAEVITFFDKYERKLRTVTKGFGTDEKIYIDYTYNQKGLLNMVIEPYYSTTQPDPGDCTTYDYDNLNRLWHKTTPSGVVTTNTYAGKTTTKGSTIDGVAISVSKTVNAIGLPVTITEKSGTTTFGTITYQYNSGGQPTSIDAMGNITTMTYDLAGNQETLDDPNAGLTKYMYNPFGELLFQGRVKIQDEPELYKYETVTTLGGFGRLEHKTITNNEDPANPVSETTFYEYYDIEGGDGKGKLKKNGIVGGIEYQYVYDGLNRIISETETIEGNQYETSYVYDVFGRLKQHTSPSGFVVKNYYTANGDHGKIKQNGNTLWELTATNKRGQVTGYNLGNGLTTELGYDEYGFPTSIITGGGIIQDLEFTFHPQTGNLMQRKNNKGTSQGYDLVEDFTYDGLMKNRLEAWEVAGIQGGTDYSISYIDPEGTDVDNNGNIYTKSDVTQTGSFVYGDGAGPHAVTGITNPTPQFLSKAQEVQTIEYTAFEKVKYIEQDVIINDITGEINTFRMDFVYGPGHARKKTTITNVTTGETIKIKIYAGNCEYEENGSGNTRILTYVANVGIFVEENSQGSMYYVHTDYLGNYQAITDETGNLVEELSFDPWGRRRNADDWSFDNVPETFMFDRGYTGHEHLDVFAIINMNGRVYDPWLGRFLSPDNFVQDPGFSQNFNRYAYAYNNPLKYSDPDGEWIHIAIGALIGGVSNLIANWNNIDNFGQGLAYFGVGAVAGGLAAGIGAGVGGLVGGAGSFSFSAASSLSVGGVFPGMAIGAASGFSNGFLSGLGNGIVQGSSFKDAANRGLGMGMNQGVAGAVMGGISGGFRAAKYNGNIWTGQKTSQGKLDELWEIARASKVINPQEGAISEVKAVRIGQLKKEGSLAEAAYGRFTFNGESRIGSDGFSYRRTFYKDNEINISKRLVRLMYKGKAPLEALNHEVLHTTDYFNASYWNHPQWYEISTNSKAMSAFLEVKAYSVNVKNSNWSLFKINLIKNENILNSFGIVH